MVLADLENRVKNWFKRTVVAGAIGLSVFGISKNVSADPSFTEVPVCTEINHQGWPDVHGRYIVWYDQRRGSTDVYAYDMGPDEIPYTLDDLGEILVAYDSGAPAVFDYNGEAFISYVASEFGDPDVRLARVVNRVVVSDVLIAGGNRFQWNTDIFVDSLGNYIVVFQQSDGNPYDGNIDNDDYNIYKSINGGTPIVVNNAVYDQRNPSIGSDGNSIVIVWEDTRFDVSGGPEIYANIDGVERKVTSDGEYPSVDGDFIAYDWWRFGVYVYNWKTEETKRLDNNGSNNKEWVGGISKDWVVTWHTIDSDIYIYNIITGKRFLVTTDPNAYSTYPAIHVNSSVLNTVYSDDRNEPPNDNDIYVSTSIDFNNTNMPLSSLAGLVSLGIGLLGAGYKKLRKS